METPFAKIGARLRERRENLLSWLKGTPEEERRIRLGPVAPGDVDDHRRVLENAIAEADSGTLGVCTVCHEHVETHWLETDYTTSICLEHLSGEERTRLESELELSRKVQRALLPQDAPRIGGWTVAAFSQPASVVGGDYFDFLKFRDGADAVIIGDVMGKGMPASMLMASLQATLRIIVPELLLPHEVLERANRIFSHNIQLSKFVSLVIVRIEQNGESLRYANAGHHPPFLVPAETGTGILELRPTGAAIGLVERAVFGTSGLDVTPGDLLVLYTDGVVEAHNASREEFGEDRLRTRILRDRGAEPSSVIREIRKEIDAFRAGTPHSDDTTLVVCRRVA